MERIDGHLDHEKEQKDSGHLKKASYINKVAKADPTPGKKACGAQPQNSSTQQLWITHLHEQQRGLHSLARNHQKGEEENSSDGGKPRGARGYSVKPMLHALLNPRSGAPHMNHQAAYHYDRHHAENAFAERFIIQELADIGACGCAESCFQGCVAHAKLKQVAKGRAGGEAEEYC